MGFKSTGLFHSIPNLFFRIVFFASWHSPQLKQGDSCFNHYCIGWYHSVSQCLTQCLQARLYCSRMPYGAVCIYIYADCICSPLFMMFSPALISLSCTAWQARHFQRRTVRFFTSGFLYPQHEHVWLLGYMVGTLMISFPYQEALYSSMEKKLAQDTLESDLASLWLRSIPFICRSSMQIVWFSRTSMVDCFCRKSFRWLVIFPWTDGSLYIRVSEV